MKLYWPQMWFVFWACSIFASAYTESVAAEYNGYFSLGWFVLLFVFYMGFCAIFQLVFWVLDRI